MGYIVSAKYNWRNHFEIHGSNRYVLSLLVISLKCVSAFSPVFYMFSVSPYAELVLCFMHCFSTVLHMQALRFCMPCIGSIVLVHGYYTTILVLLVFDYYFACYIMGIESIVLVHGWYPNIWMLLVFDYYFYYYFADYMTCIGRIVHVHGYCTTILVFTIIRLLLLLLLYLLYDEYM